MRRAACDAFARALNNDDEINYILPVQIAQEKNIAQEKFILKFMLKLASEERVENKEALVDVLYSMLRGPNYKDKKLFIDTMDGVKFSQCLIYEPDYDVKL